MAIVKPGILQVRPYSLAKASFCSPRLLATSAERETFIAKNRDNPMNLGCVVSPTDATASEPGALTIRESTNPARATKGFYNSRSCHG